MFVSRTYLVAACRRVGEVKSESCCIHSETQSNTRYDAHKMLPR
jgi:hypothetical protein